VRHDAAAGTLASSRSMTLSPPSQAKAGRGKIWRTTCSSTVDGGDARGERGQEPGTARGTTRVGEKAAPLASQGIDKKLAHEARRGDEARRFTQPGRNVTRRSFRGCAAHPAQPLCPVRVTQRRAAPVLSRTCSMVIGRLG